MTIKNYKLTRLSKTIYAALAAVTALAVLAVTFGKDLGIGIPNWEDIGKATGVYESLDADFSVHFLDVGKADAIYINSGEYDVLIDAGEDTTSRQVNKYMQRLGVDDLELVIATHPDKDHIGGMQHIIEDFPIDTFWMTKLDKKIEPDTKTYQRMKDAVSEFNVKVEYKKSGDSLKLGDMTIDVLSPSKSYDNTNDSSLVVKITYGKTKFLFMGDASKSVENDLIEQGIDVSADVIKLGHHGSKTSSGEKFLQRVNPNIAVISVGPDKNNLPSDEVLENLSELTIPFYRTDECSDITVTSDGREIAVSTIK